MIVAQYLCAIKELIMTYKSSTKDVRLNLVVPPELKGRLTRMAAAQKRKISALVRESIEEKLARMDREIFEKKMREAYLEMAGENLVTADEFKYPDAENL
jgi:predicted transcriptional regulator